MTRKIAITLVAVSFLAQGAHLNAPTPGGSVLPTNQSMKAVLNETPRHGEWHRVETGSATILSYVVYPDRSDRAPVLMITSRGQKLTDLLRAVADQAAQEGFIGVVPDLIAGQSQIQSVRAYALRLPAANGKSADLRFTAETAGQSANMEIAIPGEARPTRFGWNDQQWPEAIAFLNKRTDNHPKLIVFPEHAHMAHSMAFKSQRGDGGAARQAAYPTGKPDNLPAGLMTARSTLDRSPLHSEWVDIPLGPVKLHTKIAYPAGSGKFPIVMVMSHGPGLDPWMESVGDQLAQEGFIAVMPDLLSGLGPNGGNTSSFKYEDEIIRANARVDANEAMRRYSAARDYGLKLPEANGKTASLGFCGGGGHSFRFAGVVPDLNAAVVFYGAPPDEATMANIKAPVLAFAGTDDVRVAEGTNGAIEKMKKLGKSYETHIYPHATHSFLMYQNIGGNAAATADAWLRTIAFLKENTR